MMRPVLQGDLSAAARVLLAVPKSERVRISQQMVQQADIANRYTRRLGVQHPEYGNGTLAGVARRNEMVDEPTLDSSEYCECLRIVLGSLVARRAIRSGH